MSERSKAAALGLITYMTNKPCKNGHLALRYVKSAKCTECMRQKSTFWRSGNPEKCREYSKRWRENDPTRGREVKVRFLYGLELSELPEKPTRCEVCRRWHKKIVIDHCHETGRFRGWLCDPCNMILGMVDESPQILRDIALYLEKHKK